MAMPIEDRLAIQDLASLYAFYCDTHQFDRLAELFTDDCIYDETCTGVERVTDKAGLLQMFDLFVEQLGPVMHTCSNHLISDYTGAAAKGICYVLAEGMFTSAGGHAPIRVLGYYDDLYAKVGGYWYFRERTLKALVPCPGFPGANAIAYDAGVRHFVTRPSP